MRYALFDDMWLNKSWQLLLNQGRNSASSAVVHPKSKTMLCTCYSTLMRISWPWLVKICNKTRHSCAGASHRAVRHPRSDGSSTPLRNNNMGTDVLHGHTSHCRGWMLVWPDKSLVDGCWLGQAPRHGGWCVGECVDGDLHTLLQHVDVQRLRRLCVCRSQCVVSEGGGNISTHLAPQQPWPRTPRSCSRQCPMSAWHP